MKGLAESSPFHLLTNPHMINRFIFGHGVVIYYIRSRPLFYVVKMFNIILFWVKLRF